MSPIIIPFFFKFFFRQINNNSLNSSMYIEIFYLPFNYAKGMKNY